MTQDEAKVSTVAEMVTQNIGYAHVFKKHGIDFCCGGKISVEKACEKNDVELETLVNELSAIRKELTETDYNTWSLTQLIDHIVETHHTYVLETLPTLQSYSAKVAKVHGNGYPELARINELVQQVSAELESHLRKEEEVLFPYIKELCLSIEEHRPSAKPLVRPAFGSIHNPTKVLINEHEKAGEVFKELDELTNNFTPPPEACNTFKALYHLLSEFERDLHLHVHLENNILFPKAMVLAEKSVS